MQIEKRYFFSLSESGNESGTVIKTEFFCLTQDLVTELTKTNAWSGAQKLGTSTTLSIYRTNIFFLVREMSDKVIDVVEIPRI